MSSGSRHLVKLIVPAILAVVTGVSIEAQSNAVGPAGSWVGDERAANATMAFTVDGANLAGTVGNMAIADGKVDGLTITFKVQFPNGGRTVTFAGTVNGDELKFTRELVVPKDADPGGNGLFGAGGPNEFRMYRSNPASRWSGTLRNGPTARNPNPNPNPRAVGLANRLVPTPHWRWSGAKSLDVRVVTIANQSFELTSYALDGPQLSFSFLQGLNVMQCRLARVPEGRFEGTCQNTGNNNTLLIDLTPPVAAAPDAQPSRN